MRNIYKVALFAVLGLLVACSSNMPVQHVADNSAVESAETASETVVAQNSAEPKDQQICKVRMITGSRFKQKTCMTAKEWETMSHESKGMVDEATRNKIRYTD